MEPNKCRAYTSRQELQGMCFVDNGDCQHAETYRQTGVCPKMAEAEKIAQIIFPDGKSLETKI